MNTILLIAHESVVAEIETLLSGEFTVQACTSGSEGITRSQTGLHELILVGSILPDMLGSNVVKYVRLQNRKVPLLFLAPPEETAEQVKALTAGADWCITKTVNAELLQAYISAHTRRYGITSAASLSVGGLNFNLERKVVAANDGAIIQLTYTEYLLLEKLALNQGKILSRETATHYLRKKGGRPVSYRGVDTLVKNIRKALKMVGISPEVIQTIYSRGYVLHPLPETS